MRLFVSLALFCLLQPPPAASSEGWSIERFHWQGAPGLSDSVEIRNEHGDVRTRSSGLDEIEIVANIQRMKDDPYRAEVRIQENQEPFRIEVVWELAEGASAASATREMEKRRVDVTVILPLSARLDVKTDRGLIEARGHGSDVTAESTSGAIRVSTAGRLDARSERGSIDATFDGTGWAGTPTLETVTGDITLFLPPEADVTVEAETQGKISTDYSIDIERRPPGEGKRAVARIGGGEASLRIRSVRGNVKLFRYSR